MTHRYFAITTSNTHALLTAAKVGLMARPGPASWQAATLGVSPARVPGTSCYKIEREEADAIVELPKISTKEVLGVLHKLPSNTQWATNGHGETDKARACRSG